MLEKEKTKEILHSNTKEDMALYLTVGAMLMLTIVAATATHNNVSGEHLSTLVAGMLVIIITQKGDLRTRIAATISVYIAVIINSVMTGAVLNEITLLTLILFFITGYSVAGNKDFLTVSLTAMLLLTVSFPVSISWVLLSTAVLAFYSLQKQSEGLAYKQDIITKTYSLIIALIVIAIIVSSTPSEMIILPGENYLNTEPQTLI